jgi:hypothetical protein
VGVIVWIVDATNCCCARRCRRHRRLFPRRSGALLRAFAIFAALRHSIACWIRWTMDRPALFSPPDGGLSFLNKFLERGQEVSHALVFQSAKLFMKLGSCSQLSNFFFCRPTIPVPGIKPICAETACPQKCDLIAFLINLIWF